jgi:hypothetical protein
MNDRHGRGGGEDWPQRPRKAARIAIDAEVAMRRTGQPHYRVSVYDISPHGCKLEFVERPRLDERIWVKFEGLEALQALVCWFEGFTAGVEFERAIHPAVFDLLLSRLK